MVDKTFPDFPDQATPLSTHTILTWTGTANEEVALSNVHKALTAFTGDSGSGGVKGIVPAPSAGDAAATKFLKADGTWSTVQSVNVLMVQVFS